MESIASEYPKIASRATPDDVRHVEICWHLGERLEATSGIEPEYTDLQSAA